MNPEEIIKTAESLLTDDERCGFLLMHLLGNGNKIRIKLPGYGQWNNEGPFSKEIKPFDLKEGDYAYMDISGLSFSQTVWKKIKITYIRSGVVFYHEVDNPKEEKWFCIESFLVKAGSIMPVEYIVSEKENPKEYYELYCDCPYTKIVYK